MDFTNDEESLDKTISNSNEPTKRAFKRLKLERDNYRVQADQFKEKLRRKNQELDEKRFATDLVWGAVRLKYSDPGAFSVLPAIQEKIDAAIVDFGTKLKDVQCENNSFSFGNPNIPKNENEHEEQQDNEENSGTQAEENNEKRVKACIIA